MKANSPAQRSSGASARWDDICTSSLIAQANHTKNAFNLLVRQKAQPAHLPHVHFFSQVFGLLSHQDLHSPGGIGVVVLTVVVNVVVSVLAAGSQAQQSSSLLPQLLHWKRPPCEIQAFMRTSISQAGVEDVNDASVVVTCSGEVVVGVGDVVVLVTLVVGRVVKIHVPKQFPSQLSLT